MVDHNRRLQPPMPLKLPNVAPRRPGLVVLASAALALAACGGGQSAVDTAASSTDDATSAPDDSTTTTLVAEPATTASSEDQAEGPAVPEIEHTFPGVEVQNIHDGSVTSLAQELPGGSTPVLLWFFAPH